MFRENASQQISFNDTIGTMSERSQGIIYASWAGTFANEIFPKINEKIFAALYSLEISRPNTPVNVIVGAMILKEMFGLTDEEVMENLVADVRYQLALHTTSFPEQPISDKTLQRFRGRLCEYEMKTGVDLMHKCMVPLADHIAKLMGVTGKVRRMDSMMIEANIKKMGRGELIYRCVRNVVRTWDRNGCAVPEEMAHYLDPNDYNHIFYQASKEDVDTAVQQILEDGVELLKTSDSEIKETEEYRLLERCMGEQTVTENDIARLKTKEDGGMNSGMLQNPADPDATYREKAGKEHRGYVANLEEAVGENGSVIVDYQFEKNTYSDSQFVKDSLERKPEMSEKTKMIADGGYAGEENRELAEEKNIELITTNLPGKSTDPIMAEFKFDESTKKVTACPAGHTPRSCSNPGKNGQIRISFERSCCAQCPHKDACRAKVHKRVCVVSISHAAHERAKQMKRMSTEEFKNYARIRNGVETVPAALRNTLHADRMPVRGVIRSRHMFGCKVGALNVKKLLRHRKGAKSAQNPVLKGC